ncbi:MAG: hypothetical protein JWN62_778 [Acidimicrobiales bacterium]|nr:hypothetical protein [Acidimicrobiales bacterium]
MAGIRAVPVVPNGPRAFRYRIRRFGALLALAPAAALGLLSFVLLHGNTTTTRGVAGFAAAVLGGPALMAFGVPLASGSSKIVLGALVSAVLWMGVGVVASLRATRSPVASWRDFWREYCWLAAGIWAGVVVALIVVEISVGRALL